MSMVSNAAGRVVSRLMGAGETWQQYDVDGIADECLTVLGVDPGEVAALDLLQIAARHRVNLRADVPCPSWCTEGQGHAYDRLGDLTRFHKRCIGYSDELGVEIQIEALEAKSAEGEIIVSAPALSLRLEEQDHDPASLRQLVGLLLDAADSADVALGDRQWTEDEL
jgi:hypothetical protein